MAVMKSEQVPRNRLLWLDNAPACSIKYHFLEPGVTVVKMCECDGWEQVLVVRHGEFFAHWVKNR
jgi:hypothetical protein